MKNSTSFYPVSFNKIHTLFTDVSAQMMQLEPDTGNGVIQIFKIEKGLQARVWDCTFNQCLEVFCDADVENENTHFKLAFFLDMQGLRFSSKEINTPQSTIWNTIFIAPNSYFKISVLPKSRVLCLSISFSKKWLEQNLSGCDNAGKNLKHKIFTMKSFWLPEQMNTSEKELVRALINQPFKTELGSFYLKSAVLQLISDFLGKLNERAIPYLEQNKREGLLSETKKLLCNNITEAMPDVQHLCCRYGLSELTLNRQFKQKHGTSMFAYFMGKKMAYAQQLISQQNMTMIDAAHVLGYKNVSHFVSMFRKHQSQSKVINLFEE